MCKTKYKKKIDLQNNSLNTLLYNMKCRIYIYEYILLYYILLFQF